MEELLVAAKPFKGTGPQKISIGGRQMVSVTIFNDADSEMTFKAGKYFEFTVDAGGVFDERIDPFETLEVTSASGQYRGYCRYIG